MNDEELRRLCALALGWKHHGAIGVVIGHGEPHDEYIARAGDKPWCVSGGNDWWQTPEGAMVCGRCESIPNPLDNKADCHDLEWWLFTHGSLVFSKIGETGLLLFSKLGMYPISMEFPMTIENKRRAVCMCAAQIVKVER